MVGCCLQPKGGRSGLGRDGLEQNFLEWGTLVLTCGRFESRLPSIWHGLDRHQHAAR
jgi:short-subunit dehydrogenase involved in D-alanine esterification of teichoic acids